MDTSFSRNTRSASRSSDISAAIKGTTDRENSSGHRNVDSATGGLPVQILAIVAGGLLCALLVAVAMWLCVYNGDIVLETFDATDKDEPTRKSLLNSYNSYSGSIMSVFVKPVEMFAAMALAVGLLNFSTYLSVSEHHSTRARLVSLVCTAATGYLITNGFNAVNVQLASRPVHLVISAWDLSQRAVSDSFSTAVSTSNLLDMLSNRTLLEETARNPSSNTALRSAILPMEPTSEPYCETLGVTEGQNFYAASFGFPLHAWQSQMLTETVETTKSIEFVLDTNATKDLRVLSSKGLDAVTMELPMNTSIAINLMFRAIQLFDKKFQWLRIKKEYITKTPRTFLDTFAGKKLVETGNQKFANLKLSDGLFKMPLPDLFFNASSSPSGKEVLQSARTLLRDFFSRFVNVSSSEVQVEFSSREISSDITFDAITFEVPLVRSHLSRPFEYDKYSSVIQTTKNATASGDWFYDMKSQSGCSDSACVLDIPEYASDGRPVTTESQVQAQSVCWNYTLQKEPPLTAKQYTGAELWVSGECNDISNTSVRVVSLGKRIQGDAIGIEKVLSSTDKVVRLKNARKIYSFTVGDLSWNLQDLADVYKTECFDDDATMCHGLGYKLSSSGSGPNQHLLVGK